MLHGKRGDLVRTQCACSLPAHVELQLSSKIIGRLFVCIA